MPKQTSRAVTNKVVRAVPGADKQVRKAAGGSPRYPTYDDTFRPEDAIVAEGPGVVQPSQLVFRDAVRGLYLYHGDCLEVMDRLSAKYPDGVFDLIFADPPYFLSNGGITCHAGKMVKVDKGEWDKSRGAELNHEFNTEWLKRCQTLLKPNGTIWVSGTHHVIFSVGYAMQQLGMKLLNQVTWQKPNPPPNLACRYFTHSTETLLWAAKNPKSKHRFNYADMKRANGDKQMKDVWTFTAPKNAEKTHGKHPTQKPLDLLERVLLASTAPGDLVLDPFMGSGTTGVACLRLSRKFIGIELADYVNLALLRLACGKPPFVVRRHISISTEIDLDRLEERIDPILAMPAEGVPTSRQIFHETKFVFIACAGPHASKVVLSVTGQSLEAAWKNAGRQLTPDVTHIVRCETEILELETG